MLLKVENIFLLLLFGFLRKGSVVYVKNLKELFKFKRVGSVINRGWILS